MNFRPELAAKVLAGEKTVTRREVSANPRSPWSYLGCRLVEGRDYAVCPGRGQHAIGRVVVTRCDEEPLSLVTEREAKREGFESRQAFIDAWTAINGRFIPGAQVWRVQFVRLPEPEDDCYLCCNCGQIARSHDFGMFLRAWQLPGHHETDERWAQVPDDYALFTDPMLLCPHCGYEHTDDDAKAGMYGGPFVSMQAERENLLRDDFDYEDFWAEQLKEFREGPLPPLMGS